MTDYNEKRRYLRMGAFLDGTFQTEDAKNGLVMLMNFNREGLKAALNRNIPVGQLLKLEIWIPGSIIPIFAKGEVVWIRKSAQDWTYNYDAGLRINEIGQDDRQRILDYAYENWRHSRGKV
ncbi:MAG: PilZ domain-containing protein [Candidatus Omnitrophica bacterium]|nr:PilZ domain-containing protein [Candidatus Omnitrophota bacterium]